MTKERAIVAGIVAFLIMVGLIASNFTDGIYVAASLAFFALCIAYAEWCERL